MKDKNGNVVFTGDAVRSHGRAGLVVGRHYLKCEARAFRVRPQPLLEVVYFDGNRAKVHLSPLSVELCDRYTLQPILTSERREQDAHVTH